MLYLLTIILIFSICVYIFPPGLKKHTAIVLALVQAAAFAYFALRLPGFSHFSGQAIHIPWIPQLGLNLEFILDGLSMVFALLVTGIGALVFLYAHAYMKSYQGID